MLIEYFNRSLSSRNCVNLVKCKVSDCTRNHSRHHCRVCLEDDSDHRPENCPKGVDLWHGTRPEIMEDIKEYWGLKASTDGVHGAGVYFADYKQFALKWRQEENKTKVVLRCRVNIGNY